MNNDNDDGNYKSNRDNRIMAWRQNYNYAL